MLGVFEIHQPHTLDEACRLLTEYGAEATVYAGGTELLVIMKERLAEYAHLVDVKGIPGLNRIAVEDGHLVIGALATHRSIERSDIVREHAPAISRMEATVANIRVRSAGTLGGNLCFAEPHSDPATLLIAMGATTTLVSTQGRRVVSLEHFFNGLLETVRHPSEIMTEIHVPLPVAPGIAYERFKTHERPAATVAVAMRLDGPVVADARIVVGSVADRPVRVAAAEDLLIGEQPAAMIRLQAARAAAANVEPTEDKFEGTDYKRHLVEVLTTRALESAAASARGATHG